MFIFLLLIALVLSNQQSILIVNRKAQILRESFNQPVRELIRGSEIDKDKYIREIGNVLRIQYGNSTFNSSNKKNRTGYIFYYSASNQKNSRSKPHDLWRIHAAFSQDGKKWKKIGVVLDVPSEDPFVVNMGDNCLMLFEDKSVIPDYYISKAISPSTCDRFKLAKKKLISPKVKFSTGLDYLRDIEEGFTLWEIMSTSSPTVVSYEDNLQVYYEGLGFKNQEVFFGTGVATLNLRGELISQEEKPNVFLRNDPPSWAKYWFTADYLKIDQFELIIVAAIKPDYYWSSGLLYRRKGGNWILHKEPIFYAPNNSGTMFFYDSEQNCFLFVKEKAISNSDESAIYLFKSQNIPEVLDRHQCKV